MEIRTGCDSRLEWIVGKWYCFREVITTPGADVGAAVLLSDSKLGKRVCYYNDKAYSLGSVINVEGVVLQCVEEQDFEMNGQLKWKALKSEQ